MVKLEVKNEEVYFSYCGITEAQLMKAQLITGAAVAISEGIAKAFGEFAKALGDAINEGLKSTSPAK